MVEGLFDQHGYASDLFSVVGFKWGQRVKIDLERAKDT